MNELKFALDQEVVIAASGEEGKIVGRAEFTYCDPSYYIRYKGGDGRATESWWTESALHERNGQTATG